MLEKALCAVYAGRFFDVEIRMKGVFLCIRSVKSYNVILSNLYVISLKWNRGEKLVKRYKDI